MEPSDWVRAHAHRLPAGPVLDLAAGEGRHSRLFLERGHAVVAVDRAPRMGPADGLEILTADLEDGGPWPLASRRFAGVVVTRYLHRPLLPLLPDLLIPGGILIYETFARGNERYGRPTRLAFLLEPGELFLAFHPRLEVLHYTHGFVAEPAPAVIQRICCRAASC